MTSETAVWMYVVSMLAVFECVSTLCRDEEKEKQELLVADSKTPVKYCCAGAHKIN